MHDSIEPSNRRCYCADLVINRVQGHEGVDLVFSNQNWNVWLLSGLVFLNIVDVQASEEAYEVLKKEMNIRETGSLIFANYSQENLKALDAFLTEHKDSPVREKVLYLKAHMLWSLHYYTRAPEAYQAFIREYPESQYVRISRLRNGAAYLFSGQPQKALPILTELSEDYPERPEMYGRELAYTLSRCGKQKEAVRFMDAVEAKMSIGSASRFLPRLKMHFDIIRMVGQPLRKIELRDHPTGKLVTNKKLRGKVVLIDFWATWCAPCISELPFLKEAYTKHRADGFEILSISLDENQGVFERMISAREMNWLHFYDGQKWENRIAKAFGIRSIPVNLLVDKKGIVRAVNLRGAAVSDEVARLVSPRP